MAGLSVGGGVVKQMNGQEQPAFAMPADFLVPSFCTISSDFLRGLDALGV